MALLAGGVVYLAPSPTTLMQKLDAIRSSPPGTQIFSVVDTVNFTWAGLSLLQYAVLHNAVRASAVVARVLRHSASLLFLCILVALTYLESLALSFSPFFLFCPRLCRFFSVSHSLCRSRALLPRRGFFIVFTFERQAACAACDVVLCVRVRVRVFCACWSRWTPSRCCAPMVRAWTPCQRCPTARQRGALLA